MDPNTMFLRGCNPCLYPIGSGTDSSVPMAKRMDFKNCI